MKAWLLPISLSIAIPLLGGTAHADQCAWVTKAQADKAQQILTSSSKFIEYCEPCGDPAPGIPQHIENANVMVPAASYWEVTLNGKPSDLAYVFVKTSDTEYKNLAKLAGCPVTGVSASLTVEPETPSGVLITADDKPAEQPEPPPPPPPAIAVTSIPTVMMPVPPPPPPQVYVYTTTTHQVAWFAIALAAAGGLITGAALTLALVTVRRRHAMRPRAMDITAR
jgi:hypothetical protein